MVKKKGRKGECLRKEKEREREGAHSVAVERVSKAIAFNCSTSLGV